MPLPLPNLDDRSFEQLVDEARRQIIRSGVDWTDLSESDPGIVLLQLFAYLTETMIYRLNLLPEKAYVAFLRLLGVKIYPPAAASVVLRFSRARAGTRAIEIPRGRRVTLNRTDSKSEPPVFVTAHDAVIPANEPFVDVLAHHCDWIEAELVGKGTGLPGLSVTVRRPPIVAELDLTVAVEAAPGELDERAPAIQYDGRPFRIWREVENFTNIGPDPFVYLVDRNDGIITFAPAARVQNPDATLEETPQALAAIPPNGREIRVWYKRGGGPAGNLAPDVLTVLKDPIPGVQVTNPSAATGGRAAESLENALIRGPQELHSLQRAVTAQDFELIALYSSRAVARAKAFTRAALWTYAAPGTVEVLLVPYVPEEERGQLTAEALHQRETDDARQQIQAALDERRPLGTTCLVNWARYKTVKVRARIVIRPEEDRAAVRQRVVDRLYQTINPLPTRFSRNGWPFGQALRASHVYDIALAEPSVRWVDRVRLLVSEVPDANVRTITADSNQPDTWYIGAGDTLYRSLNNGESFEQVNRFPDEQVEVIRSHPDRPGFIAVATTLASGNDSRVYVSENCGETWEFTPYTLNGFVARDLAWMPRRTQPVLLLAADVGLFELIVAPGGGLNQLVVNPSDQDLGFYTIAVSTYGAEGVNVAVAAQNTGGVYLSSDGGVTKSFRKIGLTGEDIRELAVQVIGTRSFLWAGAAAPGGEDVGKGCFVWELRGAEDDPLGFRPMSKGWKGGSCRSLAFLGTWVLAASHRGGVLRLDFSVSNPEWQMPDINCGLPLRDPGRFQPVDAVAADPEGELLLAGGIVGVFRSADQGVHYEPVSNREFLERVTLPQTWLFVCDTPEIEVVPEDEAN
ncbi:MAG: putative baseplate assembly protein [Chloroflexi bacterium]|nr:putative baseplate assembly protein [Chloroflexota bacterium]